MAQVTVSTFAEDDLDFFLQMSKLEYGSSPSTNSDHIKWKHLDSPFGESSYVSLIESENVVGRTLIQPRLLCSASKVFKAASIMDLLIDSEHRTTPSNFINITKASGDVEGLDLIYHTSNERSFPLYSRLFRFSNPFSLKAFAFPVRAAGIFSLIVGRRVEIIDWLTAPFRWLLWVIAYAVESFVGLDVSQRAMSDVDLEKLCMKCVRQSGPQLARTNDFLKWRFFDAPLWPATVYRVDRRGVFLGYVVTREVVLGGLNYLVLMDFVLDTDMPRFTQIALRLWLIRKAIVSKADALFTMVNASSRVARKAVGFPLINIPERFLPHATPIFIRARGNDSKWLESDQSIHFTLADLDYF